MKVCIVVMAFRRADDLSVALPNMLRYEKDTPHVVAIDPSTDAENIGQIRVCNLYGVPYVVWPGTIGQPMAFNKLHEITPADWLYCKHMDSVFTGPTIERLLEVAEDDVGAVQPPVTNCHCIDFTERDWANPPPIIPKDYGMVGFDPPPPEVSRLHCEFLINRKALLECQVPPDVYHFDEGFTILLRKRGWRMLRVDDCPRVLHLGGRTFPHDLPNYPGGNFTDRAQALAKMECE
jgi:GT2 family glycosyltransferase